MKGWVALVVLSATFLSGGAVLASGSADAGANTDLKPPADSACRPPSVDGTGQVSITCPGIADNALRYLENQLSKQARQLGEPSESRQSTTSPADIAARFKQQTKDRQKQSLLALDVISRQQAEDWQKRYLFDINTFLRHQAEDWQKRYRALSARLADASEKNAAVKPALALIQQGAFDQAAEILQTLALKQASQAALAAATYYDLADLAMLRFSLVEALSDYSNAVHYQPDHPVYAEAYARASYAEHNYSEAETGWTTALRRWRELAAADPGAYRPAVATTLNTLGILYGRTARPADAEAAFHEALSIRRDLAAHDPGTYRPAITATLNNLGFFYGVVDRPADREKAYAEALSIYRDLAAGDPGTYRADVAATLNMLGKLYTAAGRLPEAEKAYAEALSIYRELAAGDPGAYRPDLATTLSTLGTLHLQSDRPADAETAFAEALPIYRDLAAGDPEAYRPTVATTLGTLGSLYDRRHLADAEKAYTEALSINRDLATRNPGTYQPLVAGMLYDLGNLYVAREIRNLPAAEKAYAEAQSIYNSLSAASPDVYAVQMQVLDAVLYVLRGE